MFTNYYNVNVVIHDIVYIKRKRFQIYTKSDPSKKGGHLFRKGQGGKEKIIGEKEIEEKGEERRREGKNTVKRRDSFQRRK